MAMQKVIQQLAQKVSAKFDEVIDKFLLDNGIDQADEKYQFKMSEDEVGNIIFEVREISPVLHKLFLPQAELNFVNEINVAPDEEIDSSESLEENTEAPEN